MVAATEKKGGGTSRNFLAAFSIKRTYTCKSFQKRGVHIDFLVSSAPFLNDQGNGTRTASMHLSYNFYVRMSQSWYWTNQLLSELCCCNSADLRRSLALVIPLFTLQKPVVAN